MHASFRRLLRTTAAYQVGDILSKVFAVALLPIYTRYVPTTGYGVAEQVITFVILVSIFVRLGIGEAFVRYWFHDENVERRAALLRRSTAFLVATTTVCATLGTALAVPLAHLLGIGSDVGAVRVSMLGLWAFTNLELAYAILRVEQRVKAYAITTLSNVILTVAMTFYLVTIRREGADGLVLGNFGASTIVLLGLWFALRGRLLPRRRRGAAATVRVGEPLVQLLRFGLPTVPADASVYALNFIDRFYLVHKYGLAMAGIYSAGIKLAGVTAFIARAFQYAWPPIAYSIEDDTEASRFYAAVATYYLLVTGWAVAALVLLGRWLTRALVGPQYFGAYRALPWLALGWALYGLFVVFIATAGRVEVTSRNFPAAACGLVANVALLVVLVPRVGLAGAGLALAGAYIVMLVAMRLLTRGLFDVAFEWLRIARIVVVLGSAAAAGELLLPTHGLGGFVPRLLLALALPLLLALSGFFRPDERALAARLLRPAMKRGAQLARR